MTAKLVKYGSGLALVAALVAGSATPAAAQAIITNGFGVALGVNALGNLNLEPASAVTTDINNPSTANGTGHAVGVALFQDWGDGTASWKDATSPGCLCEGWGVSAFDGAVSHSGFANRSSGTGGLTADSFTSTASEATATVHVTSLAGLIVEQHYAPSASSSLYQDVVTITNSTGGALSDVRYVRVMDWDVPNTEFSEFVTLQGVGLGDLEYSSDDGFDSANPLIANPGGILQTNANFTDSGPADHGAYFRFNFGSLGVGESKTFTIFYGATKTEADAFAALIAVNAEGIYSFGQSRPPSGDPLLGTPATFIFGFGGVGAPPVVDPHSAVPEPASLLLLGTGVAAAIRARRRRK